MAKIRDWSSVFGYRQNPIATGFPRLKTDNRRLATSFFTLLLASGRATVGHFYKTNPRAAGRCFA